MTVHPHQTSVRRSLGPDRYSTATVLFEGHIHLSVLLTPLIAGNLHVT